MIAEERQEASIAEVEPAAEVPAEAAMAPAAVEPAMAAAAPAPVAAAPISGLPFVLDADQLRAVAEAAGLEWISSDAAKVAAAREALEREPKTVHLGREPRPPVVIDEGPLVLVETRKDLSQYKLPFETASH